LTLDYLKETSGATPSLRRAVDKTGC